MPHIHIGPMVQQLVSEHSLIPCVDSLMRAIRKRTPNLSRDKARDIAVAHIVMALAAAKEAGE